MDDYSKEKWVVLYTSAILELKHAFMAGRILEARNEIVKRLELLRDATGPNQIERRAIADALNNLSVLEREESKYNAQQQRQAAQSALEKLKTIHPAGEKPPPDEGSET